MTVLNGSFTQEPVHAYIVRCGVVFFALCFVSSRSQFSLRCVGRIIIEFELVEAFIQKHATHTQAWMKHKENLILMERYHFFASSCQQFGFNCKSLAELKNDENETDGALSKILKLLKQVHCTFFDKLKEDPVDRDVRQVLSSVRSETLSGCVIVFSRIIHYALPTLRKMAELMGATCLTELDPTVTHVVATDAGTEKSRWAVKENKFLVHPRWIEAANYFWQKQPEENFVLKKMNYSLTHSLTHSLYNRPLFIVCLDVIDSGHKVLKGYLIHA